MGIAYIKISVKLCQHHREICSFTYTGREKIVTTRFVIAQLDDKPRHHLMMT